MIGSLGFQEIAGFARQTTKLCLIVRRRIPEVLHGSICTFQNSLAAMLWNLISTNNLHHHGAPWEERSVLLRMNICSGRGVDSSPPPPGPPGPGPGACSSALSYPPAARDPGPAASTTGPHTHFYPLEDEDLGDSRGLSPGAICRCVRVRVRVRVRVMG